MPNRSYNSIVFKLDNMGWYLFFSIEFVIPPSGLTPEKRLFKKPPPLLKPIRPPCATATPYFFSSNLFLSISISSLRLFKNCSFSIASLIRL